MLSLGEFVFSTYLEAEACEGVDTVIADLLEPLVVTNSPLTHMPYIYHHWIGEAESVIPIQDH